MSRVMLKSTRVSAKKKKKKKERKKKEDGKNRPEQFLLKDTWYLWGKNSENMQLLDVLVCNLAN